jgi:hypothetical protein
VPKRQVGLARRALQRRAWRTWRSSSSSSWLHGIRRPVLGAAAAAAGAVPDILSSYVHRMKRVSETRLPRPRRRRRVRAACGRAEGRARDRRKRPRRAGGASVVGLRLSTIRQTHI